MSEERVVQTRPDNQWHLDKRVNISMIVGLVIQAVTLAVIFGALFQRVDHLESFHNDDREVSERLTAVEVRGIRMESQLDRVEKKLDRAIERDTE